VIHKLGNSKPERFRESLEGMEVRQTRNKEKFGTLINCIASQAPVAHACNPSYSGSKDQENCG
jgi:hypothetical protein